MDGVFSNEEYIKSELSTITVRDMFDYLKKEVAEYYE